MLVYDYALISVVIACGYWGYYFLRHQPNGTPTFGAMQVGAAVLSALGLVNRDGDHELLGILGAIGLGAGTCLLVVGPLVRALARRFAAAERVGIAARLLDVAEVLSPGSGVAEEKSLLAAMKEIREGRVEQTVEALTNAKHGAPAEARLAIDERIAMLYLAAYRWQDAIAHAEEHLIPSIERPSPPPSVSLRDALGIAPPVWVELLGAYGRTGDLDQAARMMARLEDVCTGREDAALWLHRARMMFLALAGRADAVQMLLAPRRARHMSAAARTYWLAVAHEHSGNRAAATAAYEKARGRSRGRPRELIDEALAKLPTAAPVQLSPVANEVVAKIEAAPLPAPIRLARGRGPWTTWSLSVALLGVAATIALAIGPTSDLGVLVRSGAMVRGLVADGEWWRIVSCVFVHVGTVHLAINALGLFVLGRVAEQLFGGVRTLAIFGGAGIAGALASFLGAPTGVSAGASGAIFGVLGAVFIELTLHRERYRAAWKRGMWGALVAVAIAQVGVGFLYPVIDQWAHGAGLVAGIVLGAALSPNARWARLNQWAARVLAAGVVVVSVVAGVLVARTSVADVFAGERTRHELGKYAITAPASWVAKGDLYDPDRIVFVSIGAAEPGPDDRIQIAKAVRATTEAAGKRDFERVELAPDTLFALPAGWEGIEQIASFDDAMEHVQRYRMITAGKRFGDQVIVVTVYAPDTIARAVPELITDLIASIGPR